ncbi:hypothetical protein AYL99_10652 [Fonsecaea erecta]|uniref:AB hydrolase-1 domain-containing protein n=1 Tax=Fonsecaea erecta TaxID=1367422 RepID=A0A178Z5G1_9EURO|nr:hypothetical protein AYL99_10652 [Fonsecaea erecta]OAP54952.1 hypothetical protein AYL99_10652 [Fonsecaea erecta]
MRIALTILPLAPLALQSTAQLYNYTYDPTNATLFQLSSDPYLAFLVEAVLATTIAEGTSSGEVLRIATQLVPGDLNGSYAPYHWFAEQMTTLAESIDPEVDPVGAREASFHAASYNRASVALLVGNASDPRLYEAWTPMLEQFATAIALLKPAPGVPVTIKAPNSSIGAFDIPAYFFKASASNESLPTVIVGTGYDEPMQDMYHLSCSEILKRGVNCLLYEGPGQATPRRAGLGFIPDWWSVITPIVDYLHTRVDVDVDKIVLLGDSFGGLLAPLAASREHRLSAMVLLDGLPNFRQVLEEQFPEDVLTLYDSGKEDEFNAAVNEALESDEAPTSYKFVWIYSLWSMKTESPYEAWTRLGDFSWNATTAGEIGNLPVYVAKGQDDLSTGNEPELARQYLVQGRPNGGNLTYYHEFLTSLGAGEHTSIGAEAQVYISVFTWLSQVWGGYKFTNHL